MKGRWKTGIVLLLVVMMTIPAFGMPAETGGSESSDLEYVSDRIIVKFVENATADEKRSIKASYNLETKRKFNMGAEAMTVNGNMPVEKIVETLNRIDKVDYAELDYMLEAKELGVEAIPNDSMLGDLWGMHNIDAPEAWAADQGRPEVVVAVIDTGVQTDHPDLDGNMWTNLGETGIDADGNDKATNGIDDDGNGYADDVKGWDFFYDDNTVYDWVHDDHGTHVSGTIAAEADGYGVVGVAPYSRIMPIKFLNYDEAEGTSIGSTTDAIAAVEYAGANGAKIINASWGGGGYNQALKDAIDYFGTEYGGVFVAAAGNGGSDGIGDNNGVIPHYPSSYESTNLISVASIDQDNTKSDFSNYGTGDVDLFAPGGTWIYSTYPQDSGYSYAGMAGTSMATPHVSGVLALMISHEMDVNDLTAVRDIQRTPTLLINDLMESTIYDSDYTQYVKSGGRLNAYEALLLTPDYNIEPPVENQPPENTSIPEIVSETGKVQIGAILTAESTWLDEDTTDGDPGTNLSFSYSWRVKMNRNRTVTVGSDKTIVLDGYEGKDIFVVVTATDSGGLSAAAESQLYEILAASTEPTPDPPVVTVTAPSDGATVSGDVTLSAGVTSNGTVAEVEFYVDSKSIGTDTDSSDGWSMVWDSSSVGDGSHVIRVEATDEYGTGSDEVTVTTDNVVDPPTTSDPLTVSVTEITSITQWINSVKWRTGVMVTTTPSVDGAEVHYSWSDGSSGTAYTDSSGQCQITSNAIHRKYSSITFTVDGIVAPGYELDGENSNLTVTVSKPY